MTTTHAEKVAAEEKEAAEAEEMVRFPEELADIREQYVAATREIARLKKVQETCKELAAEELKKKDARMFTLDGVNIMGYNKTHKKELNKDRLENDFGKDVIAAYIEIKEGKQFYCAK